ncbi:MAG: hypothetical protein ACFFEU_11885 [Candidatus Thorarchaeota archaeon]
MTESTNGKMGFENKHSKLRMRRIALFSFILMMVAATVVISLLQLSGYAGTMEDTQLGFNADIIKNYFSLMSAADMGLFVTANLADYLFILFYGLFFYSAARLISWNYKEGLQKRSGLFLALLGIIAAVLDGIENVFLLLMTADPAGFASWLAIAHSSFAFTKFLFMYAAMAWTVAGFVLNRTPLSTHLMVSQVV